MIKHFHTWDLFREKNVECVLFKKKIENWDKQEDKVKL